MNIMPLPPRDAKKLSKLCGMFGSDHAGERANAAAAADRLIREHGLTWPILLGVEKITPAEISDYDRVAICLGRSDLMTPWELKFLNGIARQLTRRRQLSTKQQAVLERLYAMAQQSGGPA